MGKAIIMMLIVITVFNKHWSYMNSKHCDLWRACISQTPCDLIITPTVGTEDGGKSLDSPTESWDLLASPWLGWPGAACSPEHRTGCHAPPGCISEGLIASISWSPGPPGKKSTPSPTGRHGEDPSPGQPPISLHPAQGMCEAVLANLDQTGSWSPHDTMWSRRNLLVSPVWTPDPQNCEI